MTEILKKRLELGLTQHQFWGAVSVSQTCGSRYESGRAMPKPVMTLLKLAYLYSKTDAEASLRRMRNGR